MCHPAVYIGLAGVSIMQAKQTEKAQNAIATAQYKADQEQIRSNRASIEIEALQKGNMLSQQFQDRLAQNRAILSSSGMTFNSMSFMANQDYNKKIYHTELNAVALDQSTKRLEQSWKSYNSRLTLQSNKIAAKGQRNATTIKALQLGASAAGGLDNPFDKTAGPSSGDIMGGKYGTAQGPLGGKAN